MRIDHIALFTGQPENMLAFYKTYFNAVEHSTHFSERTGWRIWVLEFDKGSHLEIISTPGYVQRPPERTSGYGHIALNAGGHEEIDFLTERLADDGYSIVSTPHITSEGHYESCVMDPDGNWIELRA